MLPSYMLSFYACNIVNMPPGQNINNKSDMFIFTISYCCFAEPKTELSLIFEAFLNATKILGKFWALENVTLCLSEKLT